MQEDIYKKAVKFGFWLQDKDFLIEHATPPSILKRLFSISSLPFKIDESILYLLNPVIH